MNISILSQDKKTLVNYRNVAEISIVPRYMQGSIPEKWWEIVAYYPAVGSHNVLNTILGKYENEVKCQKDFDILIDGIMHENNFIAM